MASSTARETLRLSSFPLYLIFLFLSAAGVLLAILFIFGFIVMIDTAYFFLLFACFLTNAYYFLGTPDVALGPIANLIAACLVLFLRKRRLLACVVGALPIGIIVGGYLWFFFPFLSPPEALGFLPAWAAMIVSLTISSLIAVAVIGYALLQALSRPSIIEPLKSRGLKVVAEK